MKHVVDFSDGLEKFLSGVEKKMRETKMKLPEKEAAWLVENGLAEVRG